jgi:hypothetical protein
MRTPYPLLPPARDRRCLNPRGGPSFVSPPAASINKTSITETADSTNAALVVIDTAVHTSASACASDGEDVSCVMSPRDARTLVELPVRNATHAQLSLSWRHSSPATETLVLAVLSQNAADERRIFCLALGTSPIELDCGLGRLGAGESYTLAVFPTPIFSCYEQRAAAWIATEQPIHIEGTLTSEE